MKTRAVVFAIATLAGLASLTCTPAPAPAPGLEEEKAPLSFEYSVVDPEGAGRIAIGDIDGDGKNDLVLHTWSTNRGKDSDGSVSWYRYPGWERFVIKDADHIFGDGIELVDLDGDGDLDVVTAKGDDDSALRA